MKTGITGGIGSGKSYVCRLLEKRGIKVYDCDAAAKRLIRTSQDLQQQLKQLIGSLDKAAISRFLLHSEENAKAIDDIVHPAVFDDFRNSGYDWMESAILFQCGADRLVDTTIVVTAPEETRLQRIMQRDSITREAAKEWMARQWTQQEMRSLADYEIINDGQTPIEPQIDHILDAIKNLTQATI